MKWVFVLLVPCCSFLRRNLDPICMSNSSFTEHENNCSILVGLLTLNLTTFSTTVIDHVDRFCLARPRARQSNDGCLAKATESICFSTCEADITRMYKQSRIKPIRGFCVPFAFYSLYLHRSVLRSRRKNNVQVFLSIKVLSIGPGVTVWTKRERKRTMRYEKEIKHWLCTLVSSMPVYRFTDRKCEYNRCAED